MPRSRVNLNLSGPLFDGTLEPVVTEWLDQTKKDVADLGVLSIKEIAVKMDRSGRGTGHYMSVINTRQVSPYNDQLINDTGIVYGPWLEGTTKRNNSTRFKGYHQFRRTRARLRKQYGEIAQRKLAEFISRMGGYIQ
jgi:hypothetical protein